MKVVHVGGDGAESVLASDAEAADSLLAQGRGLMFRRSIPDDYGLVFRFGRPTTRSLHMLFVPFPIDAVWLLDGEVTAVKRLRPWLGHGRARGDTVVELPAGAAVGVEPGDVVRIEE
ncbi:MAG: DUF192 domain-containing protein [Haloferacaceae archaeon]